MRMVHEIRQNQIEKGRVERKMIVEERMRQKEEERAKKSQMWKDQRKEERVLKKAKPLYKKIEEEYKSWIE